MPSSLVKLPELAAFIIIPLCSIIGIAFGIYQWFVVSKVRVYSQTSNGSGQSQPLTEEGERETYSKVDFIQKAISKGSNSFLATEFKYIGVFMAGFSVLIFVLLGAEHKFSVNWTVVDNVKQTPSLYNAAFTTGAFLLGATTSLLCGYLGMKIATYANGRTALEARKGVAEAFIVAFQAGSVMGFLLTGLGLIVLYIALVGFSQVYIYGPGNNDWTGLLEAIAGYGLGGSSIALFGRVGGGIYTKAADVGADLVGKIEQNIPEDDPRNPAVVADNVGDNVGDIAGMGSDLFGSFAEGTCAALVIASLSPELTQSWSSVIFPLLITAVGIIVSLVTTLFATHIFPARNVKTVESTLKMQLIISTAIQVPLLLIITFLSLPATFRIPVPGIKESVHGEEYNSDAFIVSSWWKVWLCLVSGLLGGLLIGIITEYFTSNAYAPVKEVADSCQTGAGPNVIFGLALGYKSCIVPTIVVAFCIMIGFKLAAMYGIAMAALGMLSTLATGLAIDAYGPISDNAGGIAEMAEMGEEIRNITDGLDAAGNTTAAIGKGFAIGSAALVSLALFGAFVTRASQNPEAISLTLSSILQPEVFFGLVIGAMLPYWFSAMTMKSVGKAAFQMVEEVRRQFRELPGIMEGTQEPDYEKCVAISTQASLQEMIPPGALVMSAPIVVGVLFGTRTLTGMLAGALASGVQMAVSMSNTGGAWDNAKKYIEAGRDEQARRLGPKGSAAHKAAVIGDTVGDPLKDTSGPSLNILIKLMAVESLVFAPFFLRVYNGKGLIFNWIS